MSIDGVAARATWTIARRPGAIACLGGVDDALAWLKALRAEALERANVLRCRPRATRTGASPICRRCTRQSFQPLRTPTALQAGDIERFHIDEAGTRLVFVDGVYAPQLSVRAGVGVGNLAVDHGDARPDRSRRIWAATPVPATSRSRR